VTSLVAKGTNVIGAIVADGWYSGYVGFGRLLGLGPNRVGRYLYGKTPALLAQLEIEYTDGSRESIFTDPTWKVTGEGPIREADLIMGESYDARLELNGWSATGFNDAKWENAIRAEYNGSTKADFFDNSGDREVELGFQVPAKLQAYPAPPVRVTEELTAQHLSEPQPGVYIFDMGQNFAGVIRLHVKGTAGTKVQIRYGEHLYPDGPLMTENLRKARATDYYTLRGDASGETWTPRFTYHGFQYVELTGLPEKPDLDAVTGLVLQSDTPMIGSFSCSDDVLTRFGQNARWTQRANFMDIPTDCPQRDERLGWMGDAQTYVRTATFNADVAAFYTKWLDDVEEAQRDFGAYPDYCPYPMSPGPENKAFGAAWTDAGVICPWTIWKVYGDTRVIDRHWASLTRFMDWRAASTTHDGLGISIGNGWGDWLNVNEPTPIEYIDTCYHALDCKLMADMANATDRKFEFTNYLSQFDKIKSAFNKAYVDTNGTLKVDSQTAYVLALWTGLLPEDLVGQSVTNLAEKIARNGYRMTTGFLGTRALLPVLSANGQHDLAVRLFQSRQFPSWGYEVVNGANTVWERWDSFTQEHGFEGANGKQNASMNSFSHYSFGAVMEWAYRDLAGIDTDGAGYQRIFIKPGPPSRDSDPYITPVNWVKADYVSVRGRIVVDWNKEPERFVLNVTIPANTTASVFIPAKSIADIYESGHPLNQSQGVRYLRMEKDYVVVRVESGQYNFVTQPPPGS
ncbi:MAG TPA: family 78 glycoside hydrolase catalytic domain, partial [Verrucomicrobiae bacterium]|nr:family 78 glycoside hydrolase catalytic domain [Verrucomicrobiae bacterium]